MNKKKGSKKNASSDMASLQNTPPGWNEQRQVVVKTQKKQKLNKLWIRIENQNKYGQSQVMLMPSGTQQH